VVSTRLPILIAHSPSLFGRGLEFAVGITASVKDLTQSWEGVRRRNQRSKQVRRALAILNTSLVDRGAGQQAASIGQDVVLTSLDLLAGVISARAGGLGCLDRLAFCRWAGFTTVVLTGL
jgi:hypothetical protein